MNWMLKVLGPISQNGVFNSDDASSSKIIGIKFQLNRSSHLEMQGDNVHCNCLYLTV